MSLALVQDYSSEDEAERFVESRDGESSVDEREVSPSNSPCSSLPRFPSSQLPEPQSSSLLPSAEDIFSEVTGPPGFLKSSATEPIPSRPRDVRKPFHPAFSRSNGRHSQTQQRPTPTGVVFEAKAQLLGIRERIRDDIPTSTKDGPRKLPGAGMPSPEDAANLLRMCLACGVPKTYSASKESMTCPLCNDRPAAHKTGAETDKRSGSKIKDKERSKRMKGQSSHATWKSESEMHLRQQFD